MKIKVNLPMGANAIQIEGEVADFKGLIKNLSAFEGIPTACKNCKGKNLWPNFRQPQGNTYYSIKCSDCGWEFKYGQKKEGGTLFPKGWEAPYEGSSSKQDEGKNQQEDSFPTDTNEIGF